MAWTRLLLLVVASCSTYASPPARALPCRPISIQVVDEAGHPVAGAKVQSIARTRRFGASALPETSYMETEESPVVTTDGRGTAAVCQILSDHYGGMILVDHRGWPTARAPANVRTVTIGPARAAVVRVPVAEACNRADQVRVTAYGEAATTVVRGTPGPLHHFTLENLGPARYWVRSVACGQVAVRALDGRTLPAVLAMDRNEAVVEYPDFAGGALTVRRFRESTPVVTDTVATDGVATLALPGSPGETYCLMLEKDDRCVVTYTRVGEVARPGLYVGRADMLARDCQACP